MKNSYCISSHETFLDQANLHEVTPTPSMSHNGALHKWCTRPKHEEEAWEENKIIFPSAENLNIQYLPD